MKSTEIYYFGPLDDWDDPKIRKELEEVILLGKKISVVVSKSTNITFRELGKRNWIKVFYAPPYSDIERYYIPNHMIDEIFDMINSHSKPSLIVSKLKEYKE